VTELDRGGRKLERRQKTVATKLGLWRLGLARLAGLSCRMDDEDRGAASSQRPKAPAKAASSGVS
jgi:hypothetical protein